MDISRMIADYLDAHPASGETSYTIFAALRPHMIAALLAEDAPDLSPEDRETLLALERPARTLTELRLALQGGVKELEASIERQEDFVYMYEAIERCCSLLLDRYDAAPLEFRDAWTRDQLLEISGWAFNQKHTAFTELVAGGSSFGMPDVNIGQSMIAWTRLVLMGTERYCAHSARAVAACREAGKILETIVT